MGVVNNKSNRSESEDSQADICDNDDDSTTASRTMTQEQPPNLINRDKHNYSRSRAYAQSIHDQRCRDFMLAAGAIGEMDEVCYAVSTGRQRNTSM